MRRALFVVLIASLIAFGIYRWQRLTAQLQNGQRPERYTPAEGPKVNPKDVQVLSALDAEYTRLMQAVIPSVVSITTSRHVPGREMDLFDLLRGQRVPNQDARQYSLGSGVIVSKEGHILTNFHVVNGMDEIQVQLTDGRQKPATLIGMDEQTDIAVLKIDSDQIEPLPLGDSDQVRVGQMVFAVGNPFGLQETVTQGIISARNRRAIVDSGVEFLQTDAAVNQGNSGGPLLNLKGEIIGINSAIFPSKSGAWLGISFAIPANVARRALESVLKTGRIVRGYLGVRMEDFAPQAGISEMSGAIVVQVLPGSPAEKAGIRPHDVIRRFNGRPVLDMLGLRSRVAETDIGASVELGILRDGKEMTLNAVIAEAPAAPPTPEAARPQR